MIPRVYCGDQPLANADEVTLDAEESRHLLKTLRMRAGDELVVFDGTMQRAAEIIAAEKNQARVRLGEAVPAPPPASVAMHFALPWIKGGKTEFLVQKLTELGAAGVMVYHARREVARGDDSKIERLARVAVEACKQCERVDVPQISSAASLEAAVRQYEQQVPGGLKWLLHERQGQRLLSQAFVAAAQPVSAVFIASGPEGGFHPEEIEPVADDVEFISLGQRILRAETAPLAAAAAVLALSGNF